MQLPLLRSAGTFRLLALLALCWVVGPVAAQQAAPFFSSAISVGLTQGGESYAGATATDAQGNVYITGTFAGTLTIGGQTFTSRASHFDLFVAKYDAFGNNLWAVSAGGDSDDRANGLVLDASGNVYISGSHATEATFGTITLPNAVGQPGATWYSDAFVAKLDGAGHWLWATHAGGSGDDYGTDLAIDANGTLVLAGGFDSPTATFGAVQLTKASSVSFTPDLFVARLSATGAWLGVTAIGGTGAEEMGGVALDAAGNAYVCGAFTSPTIAFGSTVLSNANPSPGTTPATSDLFVAKLTPAGTWQWATRAGGTSYDRAAGIAVDATGRAYITGGFGNGTTAFGPTSLTNSGTANTLDVFVAALDAAGAWRWATQAGGPDAEAAMALALTAADEVVITGEFLSRSAQFGPLTLANTSAASQSDAFLAKLDAAGAWQWALGTSGTGDESGTALILDPYGGIGVLGIYWGPATFGSTTLAGNAIFSNVFLAKIYESGPLAITALAPSSGAPGQTVTVTGSGFVSVTAVLFNGTPAASFAVQSTTRLTAVAPTGATAGPVSVRTAGGTGSSATVFTPTTALSAAAAGSRLFTISPNPASTYIRVPGQPAGTRVQLLDALGRVAREITISADAQVSVLGLAPGLYTLRATNAQGRPVLGRVLVQ
ncbi:T9SS type A sorting domain-containing protein [Hymenobacter sp. BT770]|uniref:T9SS type A sorting domain-containing protein n=1 Tax=Hymenobacter sp. BT770 TaxID=2886942 RepID=UPI001D12A8B1|nr:T9SS type A sorting domain-containing protein [Hymenobacter sp. BT770]MCC3155400.1 T9SS type A sorting domain-containing protein [Hymenobacter sp. BT770]MDO3417423.1 T9SS type A sorting domain-containing protein [Hymenobacter sp. BT770]